LILTQNKNESYEDFKKRHLIASSAKQRDFQRSKVYESEKVLKRHIKVRFKNMETIINWTNENVLPYMKEKYGVEEIVIKDGRGRRSACSLHDRTTLKMPKWSRKDYVLLHEIAHIPTTDSHGPVFCALYLELVEKFIGVEAMEALKERFDKNKVKYKVESYYE